MESAITNLESTLIPNLVATGEPVAAGIGLQIGLDVIDALSIAVLLKTAKVEDRWFLVAVPQSESVGLFSGGAIGIGHNVDAKANDLHRVAGSIQKAMGTDQRTDLKRRLIDDFC